MDKAILALLAWMIGFDAISFYFGWIKPPRVLAHYSKASFIVLTFILMPFTAYVLWGQATAVERLEAEGVVPHPSIINSVGISSGTITKGTWMFSADATPAEVMEFYKNENNRPGWVTDTQSPVMIMFRKDGRELVIAADREWSEDPTMIMYKFDTLASD